MNLLNKVKRKSYHFGQVVLILGLATTVSNASDIEIYKKATAGSTTLMLLLDISGSMGTSSIKTDYNLSSCSSGTDTASGGYTRSYCKIASRTASNDIKEQCTLSGSNYYCYSRIDRLKDGVFDLLNGNTEKSIAALSDEKVIGLASLGVYDTTYHNTGAVLVPARALSTVLSTGITQRQAILNKVKTFSATTNTPTAQSYTEVGSYMLGTTTAERNDLQAYFVASSSRYSGYYKICLEWNNSTCTTWSPSGNSWYTGFSNTSSHTKGTSTTLNNLAGNYYIGVNPYSGFPYSASETKNTAQNAYMSPLSTNSTQCSGQGIYVLTDGEPNVSSTSIAKGLMQTALTSTYSNNLTCNGGLLASGDSETGWSCIGDFSQLLRNRTVSGSTTTNKMNPLGLDIKTAVVGFGSSFNGITSYDRALTQTKNIENINSSSADENVKNAAKLGVYGGGGWYSGSSSEDVVKSVNNFITNLTTDIPAVTTGASYIPTDALNPSVVQNYAYSAQFQPTPAEIYQLWAGNLKKYNVVDGYIKDIQNNDIVDSTGTYVTNYDIWSQNAETALKETGGVKGVLPIGTTSDIANRKLLTNRNTSGIKTDTKLNQIGANYVTNTTDTDRGYLLSLLGYSITDPSNTSTLPTSISQLSSLASLRQVGAVMHSTPILLTQSGKITTTNGVTTTSNRDDHILFGTTQGVLSVVNAKNGLEDFAFVPNELITNQKSAFLTNTATHGFSSSTYQPLYYGIDGAWTSYTNYVVKADGSLTVGTSDIAGSSASGMQMVYGGLRMGGRSYYALNLQDISKPQIAFHIDPNTKTVFCNSESQVCTNTKKVYKELAFMGQSWSKPSIGWVKWKGAKRLVMFVGGGYDAGGDNGDGSFSSTTGERTAFSGYEDEYSQNNKIGSGVYMFDAQTGDLLWWAGANATSTNTTSGVQYTTSNNMQYSVVSEIKTVDRNSDGLIDHLYFGDLGGQVWRVDLNNSLTSTTDTSLFSKTPVRLLNLNNGKYSPRFYETPAFSTYSENGAKFGVLSIGSGNKSSPLFNTSDTNYKNDAIYNIYDKDVALTSLFTISNSAYTLDYSKGNLNTQDVVLNKLGKLSSNTNTTSFAPYANYAGWYYVFASSSIQDEKLINATPTVLDSDLYVTTFDGSKDGSSGNCGSGVKGQTYTTQFCMPYGVCSSSGSSSKFLSHVAIGAGIVAPSVGSTDSDGTTRVLITSTGKGGGAQGDSKSYTSNLELVSKRWYETMK